MYGLYLKWLSYGKLKTTQKTIGFQTKEVICVTFNLLQLCYDEPKMYAEMYSGLIKYDGGQEGNGTHLVINFIECHKWSFRVY